MQPTCADMRVVPWAVLPDRFPYIRSALMSTARGHRPALRAGAGASPNTALYRRAGNSMIAVLPSYGVAVQRTNAFGEAPGLLSLWHFTQAFRTALADDSVGGILLDVDSSGGSVYDIAELADEIYRVRPRKPIFAVANSLAASGAYCIASAASEFYVTPGGEVGSIGIVAAHQDVSKGLERAGIETTLVKAGKYKTEGSPLGPLGADAQRHMQSRVNEYFRMLVGAIAKHRGVPESAVRHGYDQGRLLDALAAEAEGMVDGVAALDKVVRRLAQRIGRDQAVRTPSRAAMLQERARPISALSHPPSGAAPRRTTSADALRREIDLLTL